MKTADRVLIVIVAAALLLVVAAFVAVVRRPPPSYRDDSSAENVVHNYLLAVQQEDYGRAYRYLSTSLDGYPRSVDQFAQDVYHDRYAFALGDRAVTVQVVSHRSAGDQAQVTASQTYYVTGPLFESNRYSSEFTLELENEQGAWKIIGGDRYFASCWTTGECE
ncbi:MAG: hypothetical protein M1570_02845 [Chloroflexi bacterium]|nr:hypothetical protein [Chloroflexota bacterium]